MTTATETLRLSPSFAARVFPFYTYEVIQARSREVIRPRNGSVATYLQNERCDAAVFVRGEKQQCSSPVRELRVAVLPTLQRNPTTMYTLGTGSAVFCRAPKVRVCDLSGGHANEASSNKNSSATVC